MSLVHLRIKILTSTARYIYILSSYFRDYLPVTIRGTSSVQRHLPITAVSSIKGGSLKYLIAQQAQWDFR